MLPLTIICQYVSTSSIDMPLSRLAITSAPIRAPYTVPEPPRIDVPPMKQAAIASSSAEVPADGAPAARRAVLIRPASAHIRPMFPKIHSLTAFTLMPDRRVASMFEPTA